MTSATSGLLYAQRFATYDPDTHSWKTWPATGLWGSIPYSQTWPRTGCMSDGSAYELQMSERHIVANAYSCLLPTPRAALQDNRNATCWSRPPDQPQNLENALATIPSVAELLPTPRAQARENVYDRDEYKTNLEEAIAFIPVVRQAVGMQSRTTDDLMTLFATGNE